jgi:hypothetical protein
MQEREVIEAEFAPGFLEQRGQLAIGCAAGGAVVELVDQARPRHRQLPALRARFDPTPFAAVSITRAAPCNKYFNYIPRLEDTTVYCLPVPGWRRGCTL